MASVPRPAAAAHSAAGGATPAGTAAHPDIHAHRILILDFGAQYTQLIARRVRELGVYCEIHPWDMGDAGVRAFGARGVILSGGPETVTTASAPRAPAASAFAMSPESCMPPSAISGTPRARAILAQS